jgi:iron complex outermembrane recepter protein
MQQKRSLGLLLACAATSFTASGLAEPADQASGAADASRRQVASGRPIEEIIVTAQKRAERLQDVPIAISVVGGAELDSSNIVSVTDVLGRVPGVVASEASQGGGTRVAIRGVGSSFPLFAGSSPIGYYLDSVPFGFVKTSIGPDQSAYDLERIEVLRGPQGTLYGASTANGLVRVLTKDANLDAFELKARSTVSTTERGGENYRGDMAVNIPLVEGKLALRAVAGYSNLGGWIDSPSTRDVNDSDLRNYRLKVNAQPTDAFSIALSAWRSENEYGAPPFSDDDGRIPSVQDQSIETDYDTYGLTLGYRLPALTVTSMTSYLDYQSASSLGLNMTGTPGGLALFSQLDAEVFSQEVLLNSVDESTWLWSIGAFYRDAKDQLFQNNLGFGQPFFHTSNDSESYAFFGQFGRRFLDGKFEWTLGARYFHDEVRVREVLPPPGIPPQDLTSTFTATTPRAVLSWYPSADVTFYASYSEGFRSGFDQDPAVTRSNPGFPSLKPDELHNYEIGAKAELFGGQLSIESAVYYIDWQDVQQTLNVPFNGTFVAASVNGESASGVGVDLGLVTHLFESLNLGVSVSWNDLAMDGVVTSGGVLLFEEGDRLNLSPEMTLGGFIEYRFPLGSSGFTGRFAASGNYASSMKSRLVTGPANARFRRISAGDPITSSNVSFTIESPEHWTAMLFVDNAADEQGAVFGNAAIASWETRVRPRTVGLQVEYRF